MPGVVGIETMIMLTRGQAHGLARIWRRAATKLLLLAMMALPSLPVRADMWQDLVTADRALAARAAAGDVRAGFLEALADNAVAFDPGPVDARAVWSARAVRGERLQWAPAQAEVAISGDLGYTLGPWQYTLLPDAAADPEEGDGPPADEARPSAFGHLLNVWQKRPGGEWRLLFTHSIRHGGEPLPDNVVRRGALFTGSAPQWLVGVPELRKADLEPAGSVRPELAAADFLRLRDGRLPDAEINSDAFDQRSPRRMDTGMVISGAGDLAITWGGSAAARWLRVWRRPVAGDPPGLGWRLAVDLSQAASRPTE